MRNLRRLVVAIVCLGITGRGASWAGPAQGEPVDPSEQDDWVDDPYAPHITRGSTVRFGTACGFLYGERLDVLAIGATTAVGHRFGRLSIEAELDVLSLQLRSDSSVHVGNAERLGALARLDVIRIGPHVVGPNSMLAVYVEGGAAVAWNHWNGIGSHEALRPVPADTKRVEGQVGFGLALDHRLQKPIGFPHRIGWFLGWRLAMQPAGGELGMSCRGDTTCRSTAVMPPTQDRFVERSMLFQSSLLVTW